MHKFAHKTVLITGASAGIGAALAREFAAEHAQLVLLARRQDRLDALANELQALGTRVLALACDVTHEAALADAVRQAIEAFGKIDIVIANAGFGVAGRLEKLTLADYHRQFSTNVFGVLHTIYATLDQLKTNRGTLVLMGSVAGYLALPGNSPYGMSKAAVHALATSLAPELRAQGIAVVLIAPGFVDSEIRQVDNQGRFHASVPDMIPAWLRMPTARAAREIVQAIHRKKREHVVTVHGRLAIWLRRFLPGFVRFAISRGVKGRGEPKP